MNESMNDNMNTSVYDYGKNKIIVTAHFQDKGPTITDAIKQLLDSQVKNEVVAKAG